MPQSSSGASKVAAREARDSHGHFIKSSGVTLSSKVQNPSSNIVPEFEKPIVSVNISNPFKKILYWLDQIRRHQTTTLAFKLSIPLIAIPIILAAAFSLGRISGLNYFLNSANTAPTPLPAAPAALTALSKVGKLQVAKSATKTTYILALSNGASVPLEVSPNTDLTRYANRQILVTGTYNKDTNILKVTDIAEVSLFNATIVPTEFTQSAN